MIMRIATSQYQIESLLDWDIYTKKITNLVKQAKNNNANLLMLPEYAGIEIALGQHTSEEEFYQAIHNNLQRFKDLFVELATQYNLYILAGSVLEKKTNNQYLNRAYFFSPNGNQAYQDKLQLVQSEKIGMLIPQGEAQNIFDTSFGKIGIAICYDSEFPELVKQLVNAGAWLILVPSYTPSIASFYRVYLSARARAIENQCYVVTACAVGLVDFAGEMDLTTGKAIVCGPPDINFPENGIIAEGQTDKIELIFADLDPEKINWVRSNGHVRNFNDTKYFESHLKKDLQIVKL